MFESMSAVDRALWRIAELGARCGQQAGDVDRRPLWKELERIISEVGADVRIARERANAATAQRQRLEGRLKVARQQRDSQHALAGEHIADAEAARRERDAARENAIKVNRAAQEARLATREAEARLQEAEAERAGLMAAMDDLRVRVAGLEAALAHASAERDAAVAERDAILAARDASAADFEGAVSSLAARAEGAVIPLPEVVALDSGADPMENAAVRWRPAWSEWADTDVDTNAAGQTAAVASQPDPTPADGENDSGADPHRQCFLNVAATIAQLLPDDLDPLLLPGVRVLRREGRLFATLAVDASLIGTNGGSAAEELLRNLSEAGFKLEWTSGAAVHA